MTMGAQIDVAWVCGALRVGEADAAAGRDERSAAAKARQKRLEQQLAGWAGSRHNVRYRRSRRLTMENGQAVQPCCHRPSIFRNANQRMRASQNRPARFAQQRSIPTIRRTTTHRRRAPILPRQRAERWSGELSVIFVLACVRTRIFKFTSDEVCVRIALQRILIWAGQWIAGVSA